MSGDDRRLQEGWGPQREEKGMGPGGKPLTEPVPSPPKPNDAATSARPPQQDSPKSSD